MTANNTAHSIKILIFSVSFIFSRIPYWFLLIAMLNGFLLPSKFVLIVACVAMCRSYTDSELFSMDFLQISAERLTDFMLYVAGVVACYATMLYYGTAADAYDKLFISAALFCIVVLYYNTGDRVSGTPKYTQPLGGRLVCAIGWLYLSFIPDSIVGNILMLVAIYIIEIQNIATSRIDFIRKEFQGVF